MTESQSVAPDIDDDYDMMSEDESVSCSILFSFQFVSFHVSSNPGNSKIPGNCLVISAAILLILI